MVEIYETLIQGFSEKGFESVDHWLSTEQLIGLRQSLLSQYKKDDFHTAGIGNKDHLQTVESIRNDEIRWLSKETSNPVEMKFFSQMEGFIQYLNRTCFTAITSFESHYAVYDKGSFYKRHIDRFKHDDRRRFTFVFYLTESWTKQDGGELILYLNNETITVEPLPGRMIFFDSSIPHEVLVANEQRLSLTGWMKVN